MVGIGDRGSGIGGQGSGAGFPRRGGPCARPRADATSGASELLPHAIEILRGNESLFPDAALDVTRAVGRAQPSMASFWKRAARLLRIVEHDPREVWDDAPSTVTVRNAWFERVPPGLVTGVVTDAGTLSPDMLEEACRAASADVSDEDVAELLG